MIEKFNIKFYIKIEKNEIVFNGIFVFKIESIDFGDFFK